ncbi:type II toxin-antitoxin system VapC family toxin [Aliifodinibius sp. S!AR15-10]|uniref:type II toxin-antitoxin system VapC family toxin n=1 Tax=Aliifodinibius sp. S!AR15-10 TaxID=2950437 RepID=UPI00285EA501|nr:type II toxin-antitoxin system VapC family toxin [Aliifodinibius sp. S!AR15-10]MDR8394375.1 type II toxin-antitoxin system VapC family toxin [Aliifodinibius sp. S!AR15-10]
MEMNVLKEYGKIVVDTDVIIDFLRGTELGVTFFRTYNFEPVISSVTITELYVGIRDDETTQIEKMLQSYVTIEVSGEIARMGEKIRNEFYKSHGTGVIDSIIAATALSNDLPLATLNQKHYPMLKDLILPYKKG